MPGDIGADFAVLAASLPYLLRATVATVLLSAASIAGATLFGAFLALVPLYTPSPVAALVRLYVYLARSVPLLIFLFFTFFGLPYVGIDVDGFSGSVIVISIYFGSYMCEVFRAGMASVPVQQWEAASSLGMRRGLVLRKVIFPQAVRMAAPSYVNLCIGLIKSTSLVSIVGVWELTKASKEIVERTLAVGPIFLGTAVIYFLLCFSLSRYAQRLQSRLDF